MESEPALGNSGVALRWHTGRGRMTIQPAAALLGNIVQGGAPDWSVLPLYLNLAVSTDSPTSQSL